MVAPVPVQPHSLSSCSNCWDTIYEQLGIHQDQLPRAWSNECATGCRTTNTTTTWQRYWVWTLGPSVSDSGGTVTRGPKGTLTLEVWCSWVVISCRIRHQQEKHSSAGSLYLFSDSKKLIFHPRIVIYFQRSFRSSWSHQVVESLEDVMLQNPFDFSSQWTESTGSSES